MNFFDRASSHLKDLYGSMTPAARWTAGLLTTVLLVGLGYLCTHCGVKPEADLMRGVLVTAAQLPAMEAALAKADLTDYEIRGASILVPRGREAVYMAALADANALPPNFGDAIAEAIRDSNPFRSSRDREELIKKATQAELSLMIRSMKGIENAYVLYAVDTKYGLNREKLITATVGVKPAGDRPLEEARVSAIRHLVAGAIAGLKPENVTVSDLSGSTWHGKLEETAKIEWNAAQSPPMNQETKPSTDLLAATSREDVLPPKESRSDFGREALRWIAQSWNMIGLIGTAFVGLLVLWLMIRRVSGVSAGVKQSTATMHPEGEEDPASSKTSAVPPPHWPRRAQAPDRALREELSQLIDEDPQTAANILRNWIGQAS